MSMQCISPKVILKGFKNCCISNATYGTEDDMLWNDSHKDGNVRSVRKMKALTVKMKTVLLFTCIINGRKVWSSSILSYPSPCWSSTSKDGSILISETEDSTRQLHAGFKFVFTNQA
jgi:hypothetical protein